MKINSNLVLPVFLFLSVIAKHTVLSKLNTASHPKIRGGGNDHQHDYDVMLLPPAARRRLQTTPADKIYTMNSHFDEGSHTFVNHNEIPNQLQLDRAMEQSKYIWVAATKRGTVIKIDTGTGNVLGEYRTTPSAHGNGSPVGATVDYDGSVWVANNKNLYNGYGSVVHIGLLENNQCEDRNKNGKIDTSTGLGDIKEWYNATGPRGVANALDECIVHYVKVDTLGCSHLSVDSNNNLWVGGETRQNFELVKGGRFDSPNSGSILRTELSVGYGGYGGLIDSTGILWSTKPMLRWNASKPLTGNNGDTNGLLGIPLEGSSWSGDSSFDSYGSCIDSLNNVWITSKFGSQIHKFAVTGEYLGSFNHGNYYANGCVVDSTDNVWVAHSISSQTVGRLNNAGAFIENVIVHDTNSGGVGNCFSPSGMAIDNEGKVWATCGSTDTAVRIDPLTGKVHMTVDLGKYADPYSHSDMTGSTLKYQMPKSGSWTVIYNSTIDNADWREKVMSWDSEVPSNSVLSVYMRSSNNGETWSTEVSATNGNKITSVPNGKYLRISVNFKRSTDSVGHSPILKELRIIGNSDPDLCKLEITDFALFKTSPFLKYLGPLTDIDYWDIGPVKLNIDAEYSDCIDDPIGSVRMSMDDPSVYHCEHTSPYALFSNSMGGLMSFGRYIPIGLHTVTATPYTGSNCDGEVGTSLSRTFMVTGCDLSYHVYSGKTNSLFHSMVVYNTTVSNPPCEVNIQVDVSRDNKPIKKVLIELLDGTKVIHRKLERTEPYFLFGNKDADVYSGRIASRPKPYTLRTTVDGVLYPNMAFIFNGTCQNEN